jgi:hypothetical protein
MLCLQKEAAKVSLLHAVKPHARSHQLHWRLQQHELCPQSSCEVLERPEKRKPGCRWQSGQLMAQLQTCPGRDRVSGACSTGIIRWSELELACRAITKTRSS